MKVKELIEKLREFDEDMDVFYDDDTFWPLNVTALDTATIYENENWHYSFLKAKWDKEIKCIYIE